MLLRTEFCRSQKPDWASPSREIAKAIESVTSSNPALPDEFLGLFSPVVLIRHPAILIPSLHRAMLSQNEVLSLDQLYEWEAHGSHTSPNAQWALWEWYNERADLAEAEASQKKAGNGTVEHSSGTSGASNTHLRPIVIDTDLDLLSRPVETIDYLTQHLSLSPAGIIQSWNPSASASDHPGLKAFKGTLLNSEGMMPPKTVSDDIRGVEAKKWEAEWGKDVSEALMRWVEEHLGLYEKLKGKRTMVAEA